MLTLHNHKLGIQIIYIEWISYDVIQFYDEYKSDAALEKYKFPRRIPDPLLSQLKKYASKEKNRRREHCNNPYMVMTCR